MVFVILEMRTYKRKTNRASVPRDIILRAVSLVKNEGKSIRSVAKDFEIPVRSLTRYCKNACNQTVEIGYKKTQQVLLYSQFI